MLFSVTGGSGPVPFDTLECGKLEVLPYHSMGKVKYDNLGIDYALKDTPQLTKAEAKSAESIILEAMRQARNV